MDATTLFKNLKHTEIECPSCKKHEMDCKKVYYDEWCAEFVVCLLQKDAIKI
ncbi:MAG: hypothetical protein ACLTQR_07525 [Methanobrevibacter smithii]|uniref:hypothetical protein n=1 Tax=Methanobrevibacter smithii TaxID=2173 RepID=UPI00242C962D|nr:hypothetical protein [Methanobrevibacter smithii]HJI98899.1 hypothetical protein [Methanobrevibacter smithii]